MSLSKTKGGTCARAQAPRRNVAFAPFSGDNPFENIIRFFPNVKQLLDGVLARGGRILVHGNAGALIAFRGLALAFHVFECLPVHSQISIDFINVKCD